MFEYQRQRFAAAAECRFIALQRRELPAIYLFTQGYILFGVLLIVIYLAFETTRTGVIFDFDSASITNFREVFFFIKIPQSGGLDLRDISHYRVLHKETETGVCKLCYTHHYIFHFEFYHLVHLIYPILFLLSEKIYMH